MFVTMMRNSTNLIPSEGSATTDQEWLSIFSEEDFTSHPDAVAKDGNEIGGDVGHGGVGIGK